MFTSNLTKTIAFTTKWVEQGLENQSCATIHLRRTFIHLLVKLKRHNDADFSLQSSTAKILTSILLGHKQL